MLHDYVEDSGSTDQFKNILGRLDFSPTTGNKLPTRCYLLCLERSA